MTFEQWYEQTYPDLDSNKDDMYEQLKLAFINGYNSCRNNWGGLEYSDPSNNFTNGLKR